MLIEPTEDMIKAGIRALLECDNRVDDARSIVEHVWEEMARAAPVPPSGQAREQP